MKHLSVLSISLFIGCTRSRDADDASLFVSVEAALIEGIPTVSQVRWTLTDPAVSWVEFSYDELDSQTPAGPSAASGEALLLGPSQLTEVRYQVVAERDGTLYYSDERTITTGLVSADMPILSTELAEPGRTDGFYLFPIVTDEDSSGNSPALAILDNEGRYIWGVSFAENPIISSARLSVDRQRILLIADDFFRSLELDGSEEGDWLQRTGCHHDFTELPDGTLATLCYESIELDGAELLGDSIVELPAGGGGEVLIWSLSDHLDELGISLDEFSGKGDGLEVSHANSIAYLPEEDSYIINLAALLLTLQIDRVTGDIEWAIDGSTKLSSGSSLSFTPADPYTLSHKAVAIDGGVLLFVNLTESSDCSRAVEVSIDVGAGTAAEVAEYGVESCHSVFGLGSAEHLSSGNLLINWSTTGLLEELDPATGQPLLQVGSELGFGFGYGQHLDSLYASP